MPVTGAIQWPATGWIHTTNRLSSWSDREGSGIRLLVLSVFIRVLCFLCWSAWLCIHSACVHGHLHLLEMHTQPHGWLDLGAWSCSSLASITLPDLVTTNDKEFQAIPIHWIKNNSFNLLFHLLVLFDIFQFFYQKKQWTSDPYPSSSTMSTILERSLIFLLSHLFCKTHES